MWPSRRVEGEFRRHPNPPGRGVVLLDVCAGKRHDPPGILAIESYVHSLAVDVDSALTVCGSRDEVEQALTARSIGKQGRFRGQFREKQDEFLGAPEVPQRLNVLVSHVSPQGRGRHHACFGRTSPWKETAAIKSPHT
jgi:hypothetical protein